MKPTRLAAVALLLSAVACTGSTDDNGNPDEPGTSAPTSPSPTSPSPSPTPTAPTPTVSDRPADMTPAVVGSGFEVPWGIAFLPDGSALVAERANGSIHRLVPRGGVTEVGTVPGVLATSEGGLLGLAVSPAYPKDRTIYAYLTTSEDNRVVAMRYQRGQVSRFDPIITGIPAGAIHDGGRLAFGPDGKLYVTTGEAGQGELAQDPDSLGGKILRIDADGSVPEDNPDPRSPVWTLGHRNVQGITWDDAGRMWATEFGSQAWDELNLIEPGNNYGWPAAEGRSDIEGFVDPVRQWTTDEASPSGVAFLDGALWIGSLQGERLWRVPVRGDGSTGEPEALYVGEYGRLRTVVATPAGALWFTTSNRDGRGFPAEGDDRILQIRP